MTDAPEGAKQKLILSKQQWAKLGRLLTGRPARRDERLPPGQKLVKDWPVLDLGIQPHVDPRTWSLVVDGAVANPLSLDLPGFLALPQVQDVSDIHCVTSWSRYDNRWSGVAGADLLAAAQPTDAARHVLFHAHDGYTTNVPLEELARPGALLATHWEGKPLSREHGGPVRVVIPQLYFWKSAKWIKRIEVLAEDEPGFWERNGYHNFGDPWEEQRYG
ncbi:sulfite oxidase-like oxidoreductase [Zavarzinia sp. CC-PAN008]|uniref:sulfite oxidase-like oxidoreductase n=1 Tax=Zavarzinia sp. CC-PAN008 TaxID=3243332 RepID=UPI003F746646